jgi:hypothetical protein
MSDPNAPKVPCANPTCVVSPVLIDEIHELTGYCSACCPMYGDLACEQCWPEETFWNE